MGTEKESQEFALARQKQIHWRIKRAIVHKSLDRARWERYTSGSCQWSLSDGAVGDVVSGLSKLEDLLEGFTGPRSCYTHGYGLLQQKERK